MIDGRWLYVAAVPLGIGIVRLRRGRARRLIALAALAHVVILANVALFPIPIDAPLLAAGRAAAAAPSGSGGVNLMPFATIGKVLAGHAPWIATQVAILNIFVLTPAGIYLPLLYRRLRGWRALLSMTIVGGLSVEAAQLTISAALGFAYRTIDVDDVILNSVGIVVGWLVVRLAILAWSRSIRWCPGSRDQAAATNR